jgi:predicted AlkP superfamily pyrophosphatase or phosphodiesterase
VCRRSSFLWILLAAAAGFALPTADAGARPARPRLVLLLSIDQFRADYLTRFSDLYLPPSGGGVGGFRYLQSRGAWYPDCRYEHHRTVTAAGHAILSSGAQPCVNGIVGNSWWDRPTAKVVYCVADPKSRVVGALADSQEKPMSPANLLVTTVGDELELATGGRARTVSISLKDRASILLGGHRADTALWLDEGSGRWISSSFYCRANRSTLPEWVEEINGRQVPDSLRSTPWEPQVPPAALERIWKLKSASPAFSHALTGKDYVPFTVSPAGNEFVFQTARQAVLSEGLGQDEIPDLLTINLASNDYVGHRYGPDSAEVLDISVQTDRQLSAFLNFLAGRIPGGLSAVTIAVSADHGVATIPETNAQTGVPAARAVAPMLRSSAEKALDEAVGEADWIASIENGEVYLGGAALAKYPSEPRPRLEERVVEAVRAVPGVYLAAGRSAVLSGIVPHTEIGSRISKGVHPARSGDVVVILDPQWLAGATAVGTGTSHGTPFTYDTHVPLLMAGFGVRRGTYGAAATPAQLAPTLSHLLGIARPSAADAPLLPGLAGVR